MNQHRNQVPQRCSRKNWQPSICHPKTASL